MSTAPTRAQLTADREALIVSVCDTGDAELVWSRIRGLLRETSPDDGTPRIFEGPGRAWLLPLGYQASRRFVERFGESAVAPLTASLDDADVTLVGSALWALSELGETPTERAAELVKHRTERVHTHFGCFSWKGTLAEYASRLLRDHKERLP